MEFKFTSREDLTCSMTPTGAPGPIYEWKTPFKLGRRTTTFTRDGVVCAEVIWATFKRSTIMLGDMPPTPLADFLAKWKWYKPCVRRTSAYADACASSRAFHMGGMKFTWVDKAFEPLHLKCGDAETGEHVATLESKALHKPELSVTERGMQLVHLDVIVVTGVVMLHKRRERQKAAASGGGG
ncbi:hypothetical protein EXIGLDRAFT_724938 [Exidia glandulosa HHB12029]|uniref:DUF6593 domain-containing protein n=1 Tax=Exidia glandulosa HHB12029 TaxID=1314781 RepID=A0A166BAM5_EXIGL|nr:hypothetical protein EXIGLDRAFT_724938 [Exidia glandulosa HHB12029]